MTPETIISVADILFAPGPPTTVSIVDIYGAFALQDRDEIEDTVRALHDNKLARLALDGSTIRPTSIGKVAAEDGSILPLVLGTEYIVRQFRGAVVHIIVEGAQGESGGTGFFSADFENFIFTASHVVRDHEILRVEDTSGNLIARAPFDPVLGPDALDLAAIRCQMPNGVTPLKVEWRREMIEPLDQVVILGYPPFPNHFPALFHARAEVHAIASDYRGREKLFLSSVTRPGCSGGPVIGARGFVVGVVEQENTLELPGGVHTQFTATLALYARELVSAMS